jgi:hypothetical protein
MRPIMVGVVVRREAPVRFIDGLLISDRDT